MRSTRGMYVIDSFCIVFNSKSFTVVVLNL